MSVMSITDGGHEPPKRRRKPVEDNPHEGDWLADAVLKPLTDITVKAIGMYGNGVAKSMDMLAQPGRRSGPRWTWPRPATRCERRRRAGAAGRRFADRLKGKPVGRKRVAWSEPLPLDEVKTVGKALNCSINDVLLSCVAGAIGAYLRDRGDDPAGKEIRAMVPVNLRPLDQAWKLGNRFGLAPLVLPIGIENPIERVYAVHQRMSEMKGSYQPLLAFAVLAVSGLFIKPVQDAILGMFAKKATAVMTNVPGPAKPLQFCGSHAAPEHVLGAGLGRHRRGRVHPVLRRRRAVRPDRRRAPGPRPAAGDRPLCTRIRETAARDDDAALDGRRTLTD
jgi:diacylglycerol O-acyltransferase / wax synthase